MRNPCRSLWLVVPSAALALLAGCASSDEDTPGEGDLDTVAEVVSDVYGTFEVKAVASGRELAGRAWRFEDTGGGQYALVAAAGGQCLAVGESGSVGAAPCRDADEQRFTLEAPDPSSGEYRLRSVASGRCLEEGASGLVEASCSSTAAQRFRLEAQAVAGVASPLGSGWVSYAPSKKIHLDDNNGLQTFSWSANKTVCSPKCAEYHYDAATDTETFRVIDNRSNRAEIRLANNYTSGTRQFQGYVTFDAPLNDESLMQVWGSTSGATQLMIRGYSAQGGSIRGGGATLATHVYGVEQRINVIHRQGNDIRIYVNGSLKHKIVDDEEVSNYHKYGCYGTLHTGAATVKWRAARFFRDGQP